MTNPHEGHVSFSSLPADSHGSSDTVPTMCDAEFSPQWHIVGKTGLNCVSVGLCDFPKVIRNHANQIVVWTVFLLMWRS
jgi:hypothetical protein